NSTLITLPSFFSIAGLIACSTRSIENPTHSLVLLTKPKGGEPRRVPIVSTPVLEIFSSVISASAGAATATDPRAKRAASRRLLGGLRQWLRIFDKNSRARSDFAA